MSILSDVVLNLQPSQTIAISTKASELKAAGKDVIALSAGEPDFDTPIHIKEAAKTAIDEGKTKYTPPDGIPALKDAIIEKFRRDNGLDFDRSEVTASNGGKQVIYNALVATLNPGDEVIIQAPYWVSYPSMVELCGGSPVIVETTVDNSFIMSAAQLQAAVTHKTKWIMLNSPGNPSGAVYSEEDLNAIAKVMRTHDHVWAMCDDMYEHLTYEGSFTTLAQIAPDLKNRILTINGVSKAYAMTGWRIGFAGGPAELIAKMRSVQSQSTSNPCSISQIAATAALIGPQDYLEESQPVFEERRNLVHNALNKCAGITSEMPKGAFYAFPSIKGCLGKCLPDGKILKTDEDFVVALLEQEGVALVHGTAFGTPGHIRISYAAATDSLIDAMARLQRFCDNISNE